MEGFGDRLQFAGLAAQRDRGLIQRIRLQPVELFAQCRKRNHQAALQHQPQQQRREQHRSTGRRHQQQLIGAILPPLLCDVLAHLHQG